MSKRAIGIFAGVVVAWAGVSLSIAVIMWAMGLEGVFAPGSWTQSRRYIAAALLTGFASAVAGGLVCQLIARDRRAAVWLACVIISLGGVTAILALSRPKSSSPPPPRPARTTWQDAQSAYQSGWVRTPTWLLVVNPLVGALGVWIGAMLVPNGAPRSAPRALPEEPAPQS